MPRTKPTKDRILDAALTEACSRGARATSMRLLAERVGITPPSLYAHFKSKKEIFQSLLEREGPRSAVSLLNELETADPNSDPATLLTHYLDQLIAVWTTPGARKFRQLCSQVELKALIPNRYLDDVQMVIARLADHFQRWDGQGLLTGNLAAETRAWLFMAPLGNLRTTFWEVGCNKAEVAKGCTLAKAHLAAFLESQVLQ